MTYLNEELFPRTWLYDKKNGFILLEKPRYAYLYYAQSRLDLLSGESREFKFADFYAKLGQQKLIDETQGHRVFHLFYESSEYLQAQGPKENDTRPQAVEIHYSKWRPFHFSGVLGLSKLSFHCSEGPDYQDYEQGFKKVQEHLKRGDAYQVNYTWPFIYRLKQSPTVEQLLARLWGHRKNIGAFAHASWLPFIDLLLVSNSPECLFQAKLNKRGISLDSMPIKGTTALNSEAEKGQAWKRLRKDSKERAELNMITDLVRNDLSKIEKPRAKVLSSALPLKVPGLLHQYSKVRIELSRAVKLGPVLNAVFPGGSITGAPKKRVQQIIKSVEKSPRGFYCGSTLILGPRICAASINIRSGEYRPQSGELKLHAGGGVTLASTVSAEFEEMQAKAQSFCQLLTN